MNDGGRGRNVRSRRRENEDGKKKSGDEPRGPVITQIANRGGSDDKHLL
jgi:hypothetical protein